ncbi:ubiquitin--protein ligase [Vibrio sp. 10N.286.49.B3]|nr:ubiquitin--protein ligase [Vibrio sp. 10N.286.49.B3]
MRTGLYATLILPIPTLASSFDSESHNAIELSYPSNCDNVFCNPSFYTYQNKSINAFAEEESGLDFSVPDLPAYLHPRSEKDWDYLMEQTYTILGLSVITVGFMTLLPESITKWDPDDRDLSNLGKKWKENVRSGPVWDRDEHFLNYVMHPYFGGVYYTAARHSGFNEFESFLYSFTMSAFFWEYGVEAFAEVPSWQDLFITPFFGAVAGELMFEAEQDIVANGGEVMGSETMGNVSLFFLNPVGHIHYWVKDAWGGSAEFQFTHTPWFGNTNAAQFAMDAGASYDSQFYGVNLMLKY